METIEYKTQDKTGWGQGDWQNEPDKKQWLDAATGYPCLIVRNRMGALCGYVGVSKGHPAFGLTYEGQHPYVEKLQRRIWDIAAKNRSGSQFDSGFAEARRRTRSIEKWKYRKRGKAGKKIYAVEVHGGLTFSGLCRESDDPSRGICHVAEETVHWFGFDCSHSGDISPAMEAKKSRLGLPSIRDGYETYKNLRYVTREVESLARQLKALAA